MDAPAAKPAAKPVVLLVDDEPQLLETLRLGMQGEFELDLAASAEEAGLMMATRVYDAIICDHLMPGEVGLDFLVRARERYPATRRFLLTGYMNPELISRSISLAGLSACLLKPVRASQLMQAVRAALRS